MGFLENIVRRENKDLKDSKDPKDLSSNCST